MARPRHPKKDGEALLTEMEAAGWQIKKGKKYFQARCPCGAHMATIHVSPSNPNHFKERRRYLARICDRGKDRT